MDNSGKGSSFAGLLIVAAAACFGWLKYQEWKVPPHPPTPMPSIPSIKVDHRPIVSPGLLTNLNGINAPAPVATRQYDPSEQLPSEAVIVRAQPSIFRVQMMGNSQVVTPQSVNFQMDKLLVARVFDKRTAKPGEAETDALWRILAANPQNYLTASNETSTRRIELGHYGSGTAFAVSREGIFLTNAHLLTDPPNIPLVRRSVGDALSLLQPDLSPVYQNIVNQIGAEPKSDATIVPLLAWYASHSSAQSRFDHLELVLAYGSVLSTKDPLYFTRLISDPPKPITRRCVVLAHGQEIPGKDVAVLQLVMEPAAGEFGMKGFGGAADRFVCLPLGNSDDVLPGTTVQAMGFPGSGFEEHLMDRSAQFRVSAMNGQISTTKRMAGGWDAFEMTAEINHGDSGGPVLNAKGEVIGLNVGAAQEDARGHTLAVPINLAKELLASEGVKIKPDPGSLTQKWVEGIRHYFAGRYDQASSALGDVQKMEQAFNPLNTAQITSSALAATRAVDNPYVESMLNLARRKADETAARH